MRIAELIETRKTTVEKGKMKKGRPVERLYFFRFDDFDATFFFGRLDDLLLLGEVRGSSGLRQRLRWLE